MFSLSFLSAFIDLVTLPLLPPNLIILLSISLPPLLSNLPPGLLPAVGLHPGGENGARAGRACEHHRAGAAAGQRPLSQPAAQPGKQQGRPRHGNHTGGTQQPQTGQRNSVTVTPTNQISHLLPGPLEIFLISYM